MISTWLFCSASVSVIKTEAIMKTSQSYISVFGVLLIIHVNVNHQYHRIELPNSSMTDTELGNKQCYTVREAVWQLILSVCNTQTLGLTAHAMIQHLLTSVYIVADGPH